MFPRLAILVPHISATPPPICKHNARSFQQPCTVQKAEGGWGLAQPPPPTTPPPQTRPVIWRFLFITYLKHAPLTWRIRFIIYLKHAPSFDESGSSHICNTPSHLASPVHNISYKRPFIWQFRLLIYLKHAPSFGHSGSTHILNTPAHRRFQSIIYLKHAPSFGDSGSSCLFVFLRSFLPSVLSYFLSSFRAFSLPSFLPSFLRTFLPAFLASCFPSCLPFFLTSFLPPFLHSLLSSFLPSSCCVLCFDPNLIIF